MNTVLLITIAAFLAMNMGASGMAVSFAPSLGGKLISRKVAVLSFTSLILLGSLVTGRRVAHTLSGRIVSPEDLDSQVVLIIIIAAAISLFSANMLKIPQSTSIITVGSVSGVGLYFGSLNIPFLLFLLASWLIIPLMAYFTTYHLGKKIFPPRQKNLHLYEKMFFHQNKLKRWTIATDCYGAFGLGTNNVANVVGPLFAASIIQQTQGFVVFSLIFGIGAFAMGKGVLNTVSKEIIPLGTVSSSLVSLVVSSYIIFSSLLGLPAPYVQFSSFSILAIHTLKEEKNHGQTLFHPLTRKIFIVWIFSLLLSIFTSYFLLKIWRLS